MAAAAEEPDDIIYEDENVCILDPDSPRGVPVFHRSRSYSICTDKLYSYNGLRAAHPELGLTNRSRQQYDPEHYNYIFFRAPYYHSESNTFEEYFGKTPEDTVNEIKNKPQALAVIRVDPEKTYIYFSQARYCGKDVSNIISTKTKLSTYLIRLQTQYSKNNYSKNNYSTFAPESIIEIVKSENKRPHIWRTANKHWEVVVKLPFLERKHYKCFINELAAEEQPPAAAAGAGGNSKYFNPVQVGELITCPKCGMSSYAIENEKKGIQHTEGCENEGKIPIIDYEILHGNLGGGRKTRRRKRRSRKTLRNRR
jgi:hypothetical protein